MMIYITHLIYVKPGSEELFHEFENAVIPLIDKYNGSLLLRIRPDETQIIGRSISPPYEIHLVSFPTQGDFEDYLKDDTRSDFLHLKEQAIESVLFIKGSEYSPQAKKS